MRERPRKRIGHCFAAAGLFLLTLVSEMAQAAKVETVTFQTNIIPKTHEQPVKLIAKLYLPDKQSGPLSAVIISPSSGGIREEREVYYAEELVKAGIAALVIDSFSSRGLAKSTHDQSLLSPWQSSNDAVAGLRWLIADGRFKADRIGVMGVSKGGLVAMYSALEIRRRWMRMTDVAFAAHIPIVPECIHVNRTLRTTGAPMFSCWRSWTTPRCPARASNMPASYAKLETQELKSRFTRVHITHGRNLVPSRSSIRHSRTERPAHDFLSRTTAHSLVRTGHAFRPSACTNGR